MAGQAGGDKNEALARLGALMLQADTFEAVEGADLELATVHVRADIFLSVWPEAAQLRREGKLLAQARHLSCPVVAIHGDYDSHPAAGVQEPLAQAVPDFQLYLLKQCGHKPWIERHARRQFFELLHELCR